MKNRSTVFFAAVFILLLLSGCGGRGTEPSPPGTGFPAPGPTEGSQTFSSASLNGDSFAGSAMIGHSLMQGLEAYGGLDGPDYYTLSGASVSQLLESEKVSLPSGDKGGLADALEGKSYGRIYLFMGINEISGDVSALKKDYERLLELVRAGSPDADVYVLAVMPVTQVKAAEGTFTLKRIWAYNEMLFELCQERDCRYVDLYACFADENGYLPLALSTDGIHLQAVAYEIIADFLKANTAD